MKRTPLPKETSEIRHQRPDCIINKRTIKACPTPGVIVKFIFKKFPITLVAFAFAIFYTHPNYSQQWDTLAAVPESLTFPVAAVVNGKIHVMGGGGSGGATSAHYAYDPDTDSWQSRAPVPYLAQQPAGTAVNGKIHYFGGGFPNTGMPLNDHYVYDPETNTWEQAADLTAPRAIHYAAALDTTLFSLAGQGMANLCQTYSSTTDSWTTMNNLPDNSFWYGAHVSTGGHIYRFCGGGYTAPTNKAHKYNPDSDTWSSLPNAPNSIHAPSGAAIGNKIFLVGGYFDFLEHDDVWMFDTETETYTPSVPLPIGRDYHKVVALDTCIYSIGGNNAVDNTVRTSFIRLCFSEMTSSAKEPHAATPVFLANYRFGTLNLHFSGEFSEAAQLTVFDLTGKPVHAEKLAFSPDGNYQLDIKGLAASVYLAHLITKEGRYVLKFFAN